MGNILVINCGSSSLKFEVLDPKNNKIHLLGIAEKLNTENAHINYKNLNHDIILKSPSDHEVAIKNLIEKIEELNIEIKAVGHRVVHGGELFAKSTIINEKVLNSIKECINLAPLHNPANLKGIEISKQFFKNIPHVAVFDTAFHQTLESRSYLYALPLSYYQDYKIRKYGFHGTSHRYIALKSCEILNKKIEDLNIISMHLGNGSSVCAIKNGKSVDTSMGFTPLEGLVMGTRSGDLDPSIIPYLSKLLNMSAESVVNEILNKKSGLLGISELSNDFRSLEEASNDPKCKLALEIFSYRLAKYVASYMVNFDQIDSLVFTGGIGENSALARKMLVENLKIFGYQIDEELNAEKFKGVCGAINKKGTPSIFVLATDEEKMIALDTLELIDQSKTN